MTAATLARAVAPSTHRQAGDVLECEVRISDGRDYITCQAPAAFMVMLRCETGHERRAWWCQRCFVLDGEYGTWCSACDYEHTVQVDGWWRA